MAQITCKNLTLGYENRAIQENLNFSINAGDYLCIVGENGSGKSTLMKTLLHLQPPISGTIELGDGLHKNEIGYLPQQTLVQRDFPASVKEIVLSGCQGRCGWRPFYNKEDKEIARKAMEKMMIQGLDPKVTAEMYQLIEDLNKKDEITIIMISHDIEAAVRYATHILHIGEHCFFGTKKQYLESSLGRHFTGQEGEESHV